MKRICALFALMLPVTGLWAGEREPACTRRFDDQAIRGIVERGITQYSLAVDRPYRIEVNWWECRYYVTIWRTDPPPAPDSEMLLTLDEAGEFIKRPGMHD